MRKPFREYHLLKILDLYDLEKKPLDYFMSVYFRENKAIGSKDRAFIADHAYALMRWKGLLDALVKGEKSWEKRWTVFQSHPPLKGNFPKDLPLETRWSFPKALFLKLVESLGEEEAVAFCRHSNQAAPTTIRVNTLKTTRDALFQRLADQGYLVSLCTHSPWGIRFDKKVNFFSMPEFKEGLFEVQDEASQLVARLVEAKPGEQVLDYCSGSGGKALAIAPLMKNRGQLFLHDIRGWMKGEAKKRLKRAGVQNAQWIDPESPKRKKMKKKMDWVLVDVPCSGTGTLRRNPDMKWKFTDEMAARLVKEQRLIFEQGLSYVRPGGHIVYATCSVLKEENMDQIAHFEKLFPVQLVETPFSSVPTPGGMDGFFGAVLKKDES